MARGEALQIRLDGSSGHRIVDLLQGSNVFSLLCAVCGSYGDSWATAGAARRVFLGFLPGPKRTVRLDCVSGEVLRA